MRTEVTERELVRTENGVEVFYRGEFFGMPVYTPRCCDNVPNRVDATVVVDPADKCFE
jgi:hypothetical protein